MYSNSSLPTLELEYKNYEYIRDIFLSERRLGINLLTIGVPCSFLFGFNYGVNDSAISLVLCVCGAIATGIGSYKAVIAKEGILRAEEAMRFTMNVIKGIRVSRGI